MALVAQATAPTAERPVFLLDARRERDLEPHLNFAASREPPQLPELTEGWAGLPQYLRRQARAGLPRFELSGPSLEDARRKLKAKDGFRLETARGEVVNNDDELFTDQDKNQVLRVAAATHQPVPLAFMYWFVADQGIPEELALLEELGFEKPLDEDHRVEFAIEALQFNRLAGLRTLREYLRCQHLETTPPDAPAKG